MNIEKNGKNYETKNIRIKYFFVEKREDIQILINKL